MSIVPSSDELIIEGRVTPLDRKAVHSGLQAQILGKAAALGDLTTTNAATKTFAGAGIAVGSRRLRLSPRGRPQQRHTRTRRPAGLRTADL
jgi:hypothetical protein